MMKKFYINHMEVKKEEFIKEMFYSIYTYNEELKAKGINSNTYKANIYGMVEDSLKESSKNSGLNVKDKFFQVIDWEEEKIKA